MGCIADRSKGGQGKETIEDTIEKIETVAHLPEASPYLLLVSSIFLSVFLFDIASDQLGLILSIWVPVLFLFLILAVWLVHKYLAKIEGDKEKAIEVAFGRGGGTSSTLSAAQEANPTAAAASTTTRYDRWNLENPLRQTGRASSVVPISQRKSLPYPNSLTVRAGILTKTETTKTALTNTNTTHAQEIGAATRAITPSKLAGAAPSTLRM